MMKTHFARLTYGAKGCIIADIMSQIALIDSVSSLQALALSVEAGSFAAAGRELGLSGSAVRKAVERLEVKLGLPLLNRTTRSLSLTGEGDVLYRYARRILKDLKDAEQELQSFHSSPLGRLKISVPTVLGRKLVMPSLGEFQTRFPSIITDVNLDDVIVDIIDGGYDVVLRLGNLENSGLRARRIGPHNFTTCASPSYLRKHGVPATPSDLSSHCCIHYRFPTTGRPETWMFNGSPLAKPIQPGLILNDGEALASAAVGGLGIIQAPSYLVKEEVTTGRLEPILTRYSVARGSVWLVWPPMSGRVPKVRAFIDFIADRLHQGLY